MKMILNHLRRGFVHTLLLSMLIMWNSTVHAKTHKSHKTHKTTHHVSHTHKHSHHSHHYAKNEHKVITGHYKATGIASWYGPGFHGKKTASGTRFNTYALTAAHRTLALSRKVKVTNLKNHKSVFVVINDRGPFVKKRIIDLSLGAAQAIGLNDTGMVTVESVS